MYISMGRPEAMAMLSGENIYGSVKFYQTGQGTIVAVDVAGLPQTPTNIFGFHIHQGEHCTGPDFADTLGHYDPANTEHPKHAGDLPPLFSNNGRAFMIVRTDRFQVAQIIGKTVVIHHDPDDFTTQPAGNSGMKIACGVITAM